MDSLDELRVRNARYLLDSFEHSQTLKDEAGRRNVYWQLPVIVEARDRLQEKLQQDGIDSGYTALELLPFLVNDEDEIEAQKTPSAAHSSQLAFLALLSTIGNKRSTTDHLRSERHINDGSAHLKLVRRKLIENTSRQFGCINYPYFFSNASSKAAFAE